LGFYVLKYFYSDIDNFIKSNFSFLKNIILEKYKDLIYLILIITVIWIIFRYTNKYLKEQEKIVCEAVQEMQDYIITLLEITDENGIAYPDLDVDEFSNHYASEKNYSEIIMKKILRKVDKEFEKKNSEVVRINIYLNGKLRSFWKLKNDCI